SHAVETLEDFDPTKKHRPAVPGTSIGHKNISAGTMSCIVLKDGQEMILSNNHVLANSGQAEIEDAIFQPGPADGGTSEDEIATLYSFVPISMIGGDGGLPDCNIAKVMAKVANAIAKFLGRQHRLLAYGPLDVINYVDAAVGLPTGPITKEIRDIGVPTALIEPQLGMNIQKYGRTTRHTTGIILQIHATVNVNYGIGKLACFEEQIIAGPMSQGGDSGSAVLDMYKNLVGLLFAGSEQTTILNPIHKVFEELDLTLALV
ncbi:unnamed protein product, partial [marine sediment metagenome]